MPGDENMRRDHDESDSDDDDEPDVPNIDIDTSILTALSPEVISKQVSADHLHIFALILKVVLRRP